MTAWRRLTLGAGLFFLLFASGVAGYIVLEGWSFVGALYMTAMTVTTVGFEEVRPLDNSGRIFTIFVAFFGIGWAFHMLVSRVELILAGELGLALGVRRIKAGIDAPRDHYILCGFDRVGEKIGRELTARRVPFVIVESNPEALERPLPPVR